jgi:tetratricopeptide (TPR) repeat protein
MGSAEVAKELWQKAYGLQMEGKLDEALELYTQSIEEFPTAEAYTFRGWTYSFKNDLQQAIADCQKAIEIDAEFGNPYNDIGVYLVRMERKDEALEWFEKATTARRYESRCFPWANLARIYEERGQWSRALAHYKRSLDENPDYTVARQGLTRVLGLLN